MNPLGYVVIGVVLGGVAAAAAMRLRRRKREHHHRQQLRRNGLTEMTTFELDMDDLGGAFLDDKSADL